MHRKQWYFVLIFIAILLAACSPAITQNVIDTPAPSSDDETNTTGDDASADAPVSNVDTVTANTPTPLPGNLDSVTFIEDDREYVIRQLIPRDGIPPIYNPQFTSAEESGYNDNELVMGLEINGDARAYAVGIMRSREIANNVVGGTPVLVTW